MSRTWKHTSSGFPRIIFPIFLAIVWALWTSGCSRIDPNFNRPLLLAKTPDETKLVIFDSRNRRVVITDRQFKLVSTFTHPYFDSVWGMTVGPNDEIIITNNRSTKVTFDEDEREKNSISEILFFSSSGELKSQFAWMGTQGPLPFPGQIAITGTDTFYVTDFRLNNVVVFNTMGQAVASFSHYGDEQGSLYYPNDLRETKDGNLLVLDTFNSRLQLFDKKGNFLKVVAEKGTEEGKVMIPVYSCVDQEGNIYCSELYSMRVSVFGPDFQFRHCLKPDPGMVKVKNDLYGLNGLVHFSKSGELFVADAVNSMIFVFDTQGKMVKSVSSFSVN